MPQQRDPDTGPPSPASRPGSRRRPPPPPPTARGRPGSGPPATGGAGRPGGGRGPAERLRPGERRPGGAGASHGPRGCGGRPRAAHLHLPRAPGGPRRPPPPPLTWGWRRPRCCSRPPPRPRTFPRAEQLPPPPSRPPARRGARPLRRRLPPAPPPARPAPESPSPPLRRRRGVAPHPGLRALRRGNSAEAVVNSAGGLQAPRGAARRKRKAAALSGAHRERWFGAGARPAGVPRRAEGPAGSGRRRGAAGSGGPCLEGRTTSPRVLCGRREPTASGWGTRPDPARPGGPRVSGHSGAVGTDGGFVRGSELSSGGGRFFRGYVSP